MKEIKFKLFDYRVIETIKLLYDNKKSLSIRNIAKYLSKENSLRSIQLSINKLVENWNLYKIPEWRIEFIKEIDYK